jgi:hypothetical protein
MPEDSDLHNTNWIEQVNRMKRNRLEKLLNRYDTHGTKNGGRTNKIPLCE